MYAKMLKEVCFDVQKEPVLLPLSVSGEQFGLKSANTAQEARPDVTAQSVWNNLDKVFYDVTSASVFSIMAQSPTNSLQYRLLLRTRSTRMKKAEIHEIRDLLTVR